MPNDVRRIFILNNSQETFTPTASGAIATHIWECCRAATDLGPQVVTRESVEPRYEWADTTTIAYPTIGNPLSALFVFGRIERKLFGTCAAGLRGYIRHVLNAICDRVPQPLAFVLHNDLEMAVAIRHRLPTAFIVHHFHNQISCKSRYASQFINSCNRITAVSQFTAAWVERRFDLPPRTVVPIANGVDAKRFTIGSSGQARPVIGFVGRTGKEKGLDILLGACITMAGSGLQFDVQIVGANRWGANQLDDYQARLDDDCRHLESLGVGVRRLGHVDRWRVPAAVRATDIHVVPSVWDEPFGLVALEGMAAGKAVVAASAGGLPEVVGDAGVLFDRGDTSDLAKKLAQLVREPAIRTELGQRARVRAELFTWAATWRSFCKLVPT